MEWLRWQTQDLYFTIPTRYRPIDQHNLKKARRLYHRYGVLRALKSLGADVLTLERDVQRHIEESRDEDLQTAIQLKARELLSKIGPATK